MKTESLGGYTYHWDEGCFPLGGSSLALGDFATVKRGDKVLDLGCGAGLLLLLCARRGAGELTGVELSPHAVELARDTLEDNGLKGTILVGDLREIQLPRADLVVSNPPWYPEGQKGDAARVEGCDIRTLCRVAAGALGHRGRFALVHRPERLVDIILSLREAGLEPKRLQLCRHSREKDPCAVLVEAVKGGRAGLEVLPDRVERE